MALDLSELKYALDRERLELEKAKFRFERAHRKLLLKSGPREIYHRILIAMIGLLGVALAPILWRDSPLIVIGHHFVKSDFDEFATRVETQIATMGDQLNANYQNAAYSMHLDNDELRHQVQSLANRQELPPQATKQYAFSPGFSIGGFTISSDNPASTLEDFLSALKDGADAADKLVAASDHALTFGQRIWDLLRSPSPQKEEVIFDEKILFDTNRYDLVMTKHLKDSFDKTIAFVNSEKANGNQILIEGHADARGSSEYNRALSQRRAKAAAEYLVQHGIAEDRIHVIAYGKGYLWRPFLPNDEENRRVRMVMCTTIDSKLDRCEGARTTGELSLARRASQ